MRRTLIALLAVALTLAAGLTLVGGLLLGGGHLASTAAAAPTSGSSSPSTSFCTVEPLGNPPPICTPIPVTALVGQPDPCWCPLVVGLGFDAALDVKYQSAADSAVRAGLAALGQAATTGDQTARAAAEQDFATAAADLSGTALHQATVGYQDPKTGAFTPYPDQWRTAFGADLTAGLTLLQKAAGEKDPTADQQQAAADFDAAYAVFAQHATPTQ
jgi:hypothetical protein